LAERAVETGAEVMVKTAVEGLITGDGVVQEVRVSDGQSRVEI